MCGLVYTDKKNLFGAIKSLTDCLVHRGPDFQGYLVGPHSCFGHTRLAFQDLSSLGNQPYESECKNYCLVFNGEIYNFGELKKDLEEKNIVFKSNTDTEVLLKGLIKYGIDFISKLDGMFSFIFENRLEQVAYLARDQHGMKPLFYSKDNFGILAGSELKVFKDKKTGIKTHIDYLIFGYVPEPATWYENIYCVPTQAVLKYDLTSQSITFIPWKPQQFVEYSLEASVHRTLISDVPVGTFFSGGMDSSLISYFSSKSNNQNFCFGLGFPGFVMDESDKQQTLASTLGFNAETISFSDNEIEESLSQFLKALDYPTSDGFNTFLLCKKAKQLGLKACMSGLGADELFGGYPSFFDYRRFKIWEFGKCVPNPLLRVGKKTRRIEWIKKTKLLGKYLARRSLFGPNDVSNILGISEGAILERVIHHEDFVLDNCDGYLPSFMEQKYYMRGQLLRDSDYFSMVNSLELRMPFLNLGISNWSKGCQEEIYKQKKPKNALLRYQPEVFQTLFGSIHKQGFILPFNDWLNKFTSHRLPESKLSLTSAQEWSLFILDSV